FRDDLHGQLTRAKSATAGGSKIFLELFQEDESKPKVPETFVGIRFHHNWRYWHRLEGRGDGLHVRHGDTNSEAWTGQPAGDIASNDRPVATGNSERLRIGRGIVRADGGVEAGAGFRVEKTGQTFKVIFSPAFTSRPTIVATQQYPDNDNGGNGGDTRDNA